METITYHFAGIPTYFTCKVSDFDKQVNLMKRKLSLSYDHSIIIINDDKPINSTTTDNSNAIVDNSDSSNIKSLPVDTNKTKPKKG